MRGTTPSRDASLEKIQQQTLHLKLKNDALSGKLVSREKMVKCVLEPIITAHTRALTDGARAICALLQPMAVGGATCEEMEAVFRKQLGSIFEHAKRTMLEALEEK
jgi:hypothetical protein